MKKSLKTEKKVNFPYSSPIQIFTDERGVFAPVISAEDLGGKPIKRIYYVYNYGRGVVRGFHFHKIEWKYFVVVSGAAKFVAIDPRKPSKKYSFVSSARSSNLVVIPPGFANGWVSLENNTILLACSNLTIEESLNDDKRFDPYKWGDVWKQVSR